MKIEDLIKTKKTNKINLSKILLLLVLFLISLILIKSNKNFKDNFYKYVFENNLAASAAALDVITSLISSLSALLLSKFAKS